MIKEIRYRRDLYKLFPRAGNAVEVGVAEGNFSNDMLDWKVGKWPVIKKLYMVDRWQETPTQKGDASMAQSWHDKNLHQVRERTKAYGKRAVILRGESVAMSREVADKSLTLVYVDGDHSYEGVFRDIRAWAPKVKNGGFMAFHDYLNENYGVKRAVQDFCAGNFEIHVLTEDKPEDAGCVFQIFF